MSSLDLLNLLAAKARDYANNAPASIRRNHHMNNVTVDNEINPNIVDAVLVDFINKIGVDLGIDYAMYTSDLRK